MNTAVPSRVLRNSVRESRYNRTRRNGRHCDRELLANRTNADRWAIQASLAGL